MKSSLEFKVGLFTLIALVILAISLLFVNNFRFGGGGRLYTVTFLFLGDLKDDAPVKYAGGIDVGQVVEIRPKEGLAEVDILITNPQIKLHQDSKVAIYSTSLLGTKYVQVGADLGTGPELQKGERLEGHDSNNLDQTFSQLGDVMESFEQMMGDPKAKASFLHSFENMNKATDDLYKLAITSHQKIDKILDDLSKTSSDVPKLMASAQKVSDNLQGLTDALDKNDVKEAMKNLKVTLKNMNELTSDIHDGKGVAGVLLHDEKVADDLRSLVEELKAHPWKLLWKK